MKNSRTDVCRWRVVAATLVLGCGMLTASGTAVAQYTTPPPSGGVSSDSGGGSAVGGDTTTVGSSGSLSPSGANNVRAVQVRSQARGALPVTGGDVVALAGIGLAAVALGGAALAFRRRPAVG